MSKCEYTTQGRASPNEYYEFACLLYGACCKSYFEDIQRYISYGLYTNQWDYYQHACNELIKQMLKLSVFRNNPEAMNEKLKEILKMAYQKKENKSSKKESNPGIEIKELKCSNKNVISAKVWAPKEWKEEGFTRFFTSIIINDVRIGGAIMIPSGAKGEWDSLDDIAKDSFFAFPSYYNESKKEYANQVSIASDGLKEDLAEFIKHAIAYGKLLDL